jgi:hypothetical protein
MKLNPENIPDSVVPQGWRLLTTTDLPINHTPCCIWLPSVRQFSKGEDYHGANPNYTYIVPVDPPQQPIKVNSNQEMHRAIQEIYFLVEGSADGAPDATPHDKLCNQILGLIRHLV